MDAYIILDNKYDLNTLPLKGNFVVGVERGCLNLIKNGMQSDVSVGDFDSVDDDEQCLIQSNAEKFIKLDTSKKMTDTAYAYDLVKDGEYKNIFIIGGIQGKRIEHLFANVNLVKRDKRLSIIDCNSKIISLEGKNIVKTFLKADKYKYISIYAINYSIISLKGFKYDLNKYPLGTNDSLCISNEIVEKGILRLENGKIIIIMSRNDK
ncbi:MAG: thiamine diphosphokinase [Bacilli bacterium]